MIFALLFPFLSTIVATYLGAIIRLIAKKISREFLIFLQNFSLGAIVGLIFFELLPESYSLFLNNNDSFLSALFTVLICLGSGGLFFLFHELFHKISKHHNKDKTDNEACIDHLHTQELLKENESNNSSFYTCLLFLLAIFIHNIPEGLSLGVTFSLSKDTFPLDGTIMSSILFIHNVVVGFSLMSSFLDIKKTVKFSLLLTLLSSFSAYVLSLIGYFISSINLGNVFEAIIYSFSSGTLLYVLFIELLPQTFYNYKSRFSFLYFLIGLGLCFILISL